MSLKHFVAPVMGLTVADVVSAATKLRFAPWCGDSFYLTSNCKRNHEK